MPEIIRRFRGLPATWIILTLTYVLLLFILPDSAGVFITPLSILGLFVPFAVGDVFAFYVCPQFQNCQISGAAIVAGALLTMLAVIFGNKIRVLIFKLTRAKDTRLNGFIFNLLYLFLLTILVDLIIYGKWESFLILTGQTG